MFKRKQFTNAFLQISKEHKIVKEFITDFKSLIDAGPQAGNLQTLKDKTKILKEDLFEHFQLEEQVLFPAALLAMPSVELADRILLLTREHGAFERDVMTLKQIVACHPEKDPNIPQNTLDFLVTFVENLESHTRIEMDELFPRMDQNKKCTEVIRDFVD